MKNSKVPTLKIINQNLYCCRGILLKHDSKISSWAVELKRKHIHNRKIYHGYPESPSEYSKGQLAFLMSWEKVVFEAIITVFFDIYGQTL